MLAGGQLAAMSHTSVSSALIFALAVCRVCCADIRSICSPTDVYTSTGSSVVLCCSYNGTNDLPQWRINSALHRPTNLPRNHYYASDGLHLVDVSESMNGSEYACAFTEYDDQGNRLMIESCRAKIVVLEQGNVTTSEHTERESCCLERECPATLSTPTPPDVFNCAGSNIPSIGIVVAVTAYTMASALNTVVGMTDGIGTEADKGCAASESVHEGG